MDMKDGNKERVGESQSTYAPAENWFTTEMQIKLRDIISRNNGNEVFGVGTVDESSRICSLEHLASGNAGAVPAPGMTATFGQVLIHNHPTGNLEPSNADINVAAMYGSRGVGNIIVDNDVCSVRIVVKAFKEKKRVPIDADKLATFLHSDENSDAYGLEYRPEQVAMLRTIATAFNENRVSVIEAGTGIGKSYAYLIPAIEWGLLNQERIVVSTSTIPLQEQIIKKDIPALQTIMGREFKTVLVKGRSHFVSIRRLRYSIGQPELIPSEKQSELQELEAWIEHTDTGERSDLPFAVSDEVWNEVSSDGDECLGARCPHFGECFYFNMHRKASAADVVIVNHSLLMIDLALREQDVALLPSHQALIIDEAHNLESIAIDQFTEEINEFTIRRILNRLYHNRNGRGILTQLHSAIDALEMDRDRMMPVLLILSTDFPQKCKELFESVQESFSQITAVLTTEMDELNKGNKSNYANRNLRLTDAVMERPFWDDCKELLLQLLDELKSTISLGEKLSDLLDELELDKANESLNGSIICLHSSIRRLGALYTTIVTFMGVSTTEYCRWFEMRSYTRGRSKRQAYITLSVAQIDVADRLRNGLFSDPSKPVIMTSATLAINKSFEYFSRQVGLPISYDAESEEDTLDDKILKTALIRRCNYSLYQSPFNYRDNCRLMVPTNLSDDVHRNVIDDDLKRFMVQAISVSSGRAMVLFRSYSAMKELYESIEPELSAQNILVLKQGLKEERSHLLHTFRTARSAVLFATVSFWEGIDLKGDALVLLVLHKLPFEVPSDPILQSRSEVCERRGLSSFFDLQLPMAVIKLKQGFGRLIRSKSDYGAALILDKRVMQKSYGRVFLKSLPIQECHFGTTDELVEQLHAFFSEHEG